MIRDNAAKSEAARLVEKREAHAEVGFAIFVYSCNEGGLTSDVKNHTHDKMLFLSRAILFEKLTRQRA